MTVKDCVVTIDSQGGVLEIDQIVKLNVEIQETRRNLRKSDKMQVNRILFQQEAPNTAWKKEEFDVRKQKEGDQKKMQEPEARKQETCDASPGPARISIHDDAARSICSLSGRKMRTLLRKDAGRFPTRMHFTERVDRKLVRRKDYNFKL